MGTRQAGNLLTKASWWCGGLFLGLAFLLSLASRSHARAEVGARSGLPERARPAAPPAGANPAYRCSRRRRQTQPTAPSPLEAPAERRHRRPKTPAPRSHSPSVTTNRGTPGFLLLEDGTLFRGRLVTRMRPWQSPRSCSPRT
jgi:preprotein translocase subunit SecG